jgi:hypothetical protein
MHDRAPHPPRGDVSSAGDDESGPSTDGSSAERTRRAPEPTFRFLKLAAGFSAGVFDPDESSRASEQERGPPKLAYDSRSE